MSDRYPLLIKPEIFQVEGLNENVYWFISQLAVHMNAETKSCSLSYATLKTKLGWSREKINKVADQTQSLGFIIITKAKSDKNEWQKNVYRFTTKFIGYLKFETLDKYSFTLADEEGLSENPTTTDIVCQEQIQTQDMHPGVVGKSDKGLSENRTLTNTSSSTSGTIENFRLDEVRLALVKQKYELTDNEIELARLCFIEKYLNQPLIAPGNVFVKWLKNEWVDKHRLEQKINQPISSYSNHSKPQQAKETYQPKHDLTMTQRPGESLEDFEARCDARESLGDVRLIKRYTQEKSPPMRKALADQFKPNY